MSPPARLPLALLALWALRLAAPLPVAVADPMDLYGPTSVSIGRGNAETAASEDYGALVFNPGRLAFVRPQFGVNFLFSFDAVEIRPMARSSAYDVPASIYQAKPVDPSRSIGSSLPTNELLNRRGVTRDEPNTYAVGLGIVTGFKTDWMRLGLAASVPLTSLLDARFVYPDEREQHFTNRLHFTLLNRRAARPTGMAGIAFKPLAWFGFGAGVLVTGNLVAKTRMYVPDAGDMSTARFETRLKVAYDATMIAGVQFEPLPWFGIGLSFRDHGWIGTSFRNEVEIFGYETRDGDRTATQSYAFAYSYIPRRLTLGVRFDAAPVTLSADLAWVMWRFYRPEMGLGSARRLNDIVVPRLGVVWRALSWLDLRAGAGFVPSPVPLQDGRTNLVDNDRIEGSLGCSLRLPWVEGLLFDLHLQFLGLLPRTQHKSPDAKDPVQDEFPDSTTLDGETFLPESLGLQTNNPGFPGYRSKGLVGSFGFGVRYEF